MGVYGNGTYGAGLYSDTATIAAVQDSAWPPRILVTVTGLTVGDQVTIYESQAGARTAVRGADAVTMTDTEFVVNDAEYPFGALLSYVLSVNGVDVVTATLTPTLPGGQVALSDAITGVAVETKISAWPHATNARTGTRFDVGGVSMFVSSPRAGAEVQAEFLTLTDAGREQMLNLLNSATSGIVLVRVPDVTLYPGFDGHYLVLSDDSALMTQNGQDVRRIWTLDLVESPGWASSLEASGWTYGDVLDAYAGLTYADLTGDFDTYFDIAIRDWGMGRP